MNNRIPHQPQEAPCPEEGHNHQPQVNSRLHAMAGVKHTYDVHLPGVLTIFRSRIYTTPDVVFRELLQNSADAHTERRIREPGHVGWIEIDLLRTTDGRHILTVSDNGIGIRVDEIQTSLATLAYSNKSLKQDEGAIGFMGVGSSSCFWVANEVIYISRHLETDAVAFRFTGCRDGSWEVSKVEGDLASGTRVSLVLDDAAVEKLNLVFISETVRKYGEFLPDPITVRANGSEMLVTRTPYWDADLSEEQLLRMGRELFIGFAMGAFRFSCPELAGEGVAFITPHRATPGSEPDHRLYVRRMFVSDRVRHLSPPTLPCVRCVFNSSMLEINAGRDDIHGDKKVLLPVQAAVRAAMGAYLTGLEASAPEKLSKILDVHLECFVTEAEQSGAHLSLLRRHLSFPTSLGSLSVDEALKRHGKIFFATDDKDYLRAEIKAGQEGICLAKGHYTLQGRLLRLLQRKLGDAFVRHVTAAEFLAQFRADECILDKRELAIIALLQTELATEHCMGSIEDSDDPFAPATLLLDEMDSIRRDLGGDTDQNEVSSAKRLVLNRTNQVVESLLQTPDLPSDLARAWLRFLYHGALLGARECPTNGENRRLARALNLIWKASINLDIN